jgi:TIR domain
MERSNSSIFISYSRRFDLKTALALRSRLAYLGYKTWIDVENVQPGQIWDEEVEQAISHCKVFIVLVSRGMVESRGYEYDEWRMAVELQKQQQENPITIIPIRLEQCEVPFLLRRFQWIDWFEKTGKQRLEKRLAQIINKQLPDQQTTDVQSSTDNLIAPRLRFQPWFGQRPFPIALYALAL